MIRSKEAYYRARVLPCPNDAVRLRDNIAYAILSVHVAAYEADRLLTAWRAAGRPANEAEILNAWKDTPSNFYVMKSAWLGSLARVSDDWILRYGRDREALTLLPGLGRIKGSFAAALNGANVACLDRHILRSLRARKHAANLATGVSLERADARIQPKNWCEYRALEQVLRARHCRDGETDLFVAQWRLWNQLRATDETHEILWEQRAYEN